jgi:glycerol uptake facilitator-like aquaporin
MCGEFLGTFFLFFVSCASSLNMNKLAGTSILSPLVCAFATGLIAVALVYSFADISGAHLNPAVTFACWLTKKTSNRKLIFFVLSQILAGIVAMGCLGACFGDIDTLAVLPPTPEELGKVFFIEMIMTMILVFVIFTVAFDNMETPMTPRIYHEMQMSGTGGAGSLGLTLYHVNPQSKTGFAPMAIGFTIGALVLVGGTVSGSAFNPARVFSAGLVTNQWRSQWVYWLAELLGAAIAAGFSTLFARFAVPDQPKNKASVASPSRSSQPMSAIAAPSHQLP